MVLPIGVSEHAIADCMSSGLHMSNVGQHRCSADPHAHTECSLFHSPAQKLKQLAVQVAAECMPQLHSRGLAALMKELGKSGLSHRAFQLFDWLIALPEGHMCQVSGSGLTKLSGTGWHALTGT